ncbi:CvfB family protein [Companilactobacillus sp.]|jgi:predicted RNA-binding protein (virulence factor B family)|uniref:CvfB family protein n=2 Tax=Companilactobacillus sp. TaxID=2767905 RepID=UPI0025C5472E|nr:S1-like domain-containing RNA-binding protein [Companilactobacillus sp.]MCH4008320.1 S1-like domain-containing RNA-binding protein [Companilactobacillus sp.]MCH4051501.1 S1-like domain-containing RNA-binding protein [Companilactobacillus sp.]MCH4076263.1 S1-like domain-containing RNA-binding protein [Companilactobacillus sp.]MCH4124838.1 S1-like domain-containing RNA-binding protein [Companilactobacillus sp.]MCH4131380.1 S1-like domain-containing RNA-binding protein [Companilactobacillus sp
MDISEMYGNVLSGSVTDLNKDEAFVQIEGITFAMDLSELDEIPEIGDELSGFVYETKGHKNKITTIMPKVMKGIWDYATVKEVRTDLGVFVDSGLKDKDIVVSLDDLPLEHSEWPKKDDRVMVALDVDHKGRLWGKLADLNLYMQLARSASDKEKNRDETGHVIAIRESGTFVLTDSYYLGFIHSNEQDGPLRIGQEVKTRVIGSSHRRLNLSMKPRAYEEITPDAEMIMAVLEHARDKKIPYTDKSDPNDIKEYFGISKGSFKRALGNLMKQNKIEQKDGFTYLK